ncbi:hypothetical protein LTR37_009421 [Vermiconidia calcicola]|uniref:Uncharacterized protein n=1 Tax=Vermiconidia calcicola TaxID=1690605 RepID=A0ACC3N8P0_9PEZI|nr:hypothetical protein LTR37_009421 [Vermiconidia calcicola]
MGLADKIAIIGHNGWVASHIIRALAAHPFHQPLRILAREGSSTAQLPSNVEVVHYAWDDYTALHNALEGVDILISFLGHEVLKEQAKLIQPMQEAGVKLFVPSDLALPYTDEERTNVQVPREKGELEQNLKANGIPFVVVCIGNFTSFALDSPYMGVDLPNNRIVHVGRSRETAIWLCTRDYVAAGFVSIFSQASPSELAGRLIGLNELRPTTLEIEQAMAKQSGRQPQVFDETVENMVREAQQGRLDALVRKKMGDGSHTAVRSMDEIWQFESPKMSLEELIRRSPIDDPLYIAQSDDTLHFLDKYFQ